MPSRQPDTPFPPLNAALPADDRFADDPLSQRRGFWSTPILDRLRAKPVLDLPEEALTRIMIPILTPSDEMRERQGHRTHAQRLARQEMWDEISGLIRTAETEGQATGAGASVALLLAEGARTDVVSAARDAIRDGAQPDLSGFEDLEAIQAETPGDAAKALVVALAHLDIAREWATYSPPEGGEDDARADRTALMQHHLARASALLSLFDPDLSHSPALAMATAQRAELDGAGPDRITQAYSTLIGLNPRDPAHLRAAGRALYRAHARQPAAFETLTRRFAAKADATWGTGGYAWLWMDVLAANPDLLGTVDAELLTAAIEDIAMRSTSQHIINLWVAFCTVGMAHREDECLPAAAQARRQRVQRTGDTLIAKHLHELHPTLWAQATIAPRSTAGLPPHRSLVEHGRRTALRAIATRFADALADGGRLAFSDQGVYRLPPVTR